MGTQPHSVLYLFSSTMMCDFQSSQMQMVQFQKVRRPQGWKWKSQIKEINCYYHTATIKKLSLNCLMVNCSYINCRWYKTRNIYVLYPVTDISLILTHCYCCGSPHPPDLPDSIWCSTSAWSFLHLWQTFCCCGQSQFHVSLQKQFSLKSHPCFHG